MLSQQLSLDLPARRMSGRALPVVERLRAVLKRQGINWQYRASSGSTLLRPHFGPHMGYMPMCGFYSCGFFNFERLAYREPKEWTREDRQEHLAYLESRREDVYELWGRP